MFNGGTAVCAGVKSLEARLPLVADCFCRSVGLDGNGIIEGKEHHGITGGGIHVLGNPHNGEEIFAQLEDCAQGQFCRFVREHFIMPVCKALP